MPAFMAAAKPTFSGSARSRTAGPKRVGASREPSVEALSTSSVSQTTPRWDTADPSETGRSAASSFETTMIETEPELQLPLFQRRVDVGDLGDPSPAADETRAW